MSWLPESKDHLPLTWWKSHPVYLSAVLALAGAASMILTAILGSASGRLIFTYQGLLDLQVWTPFTYVLVNWPNIWLLIGCFMLWRFGEAVERHLGRRSFVRLLILLLLVSPLLVTAAGLLGWQRGCAGLTELEFGVFIAFATLYPRAQISLILFTLEVWIIAAIFVAVYALSYVGGRDWISLVIFAGQVGTAFAYIRYEQGVLKLPELPKFKAMRPPASSSSSSTARARVSPAVAAATPAKPKKNSPAVDDILDKISREGMQSLTPDERRILDQASEDLQKRGR